MSEAWDDEGFGGENDWGEESLESDLEEDALDVEDPRLNPPGTTTSSSSRSALDFRDLLRRRRMVRHYGPEAVRLEAIQRIVETVRRAPSAGYSQGQRLLVVTEPAARSEIARIMGETGWTAAEGREPWLESAPVHILVCTREEDYHERYRRPDKLQEGEEIEWPVPFWFVDAGAALMLLLLAAIDEGLAAGFSGVPRGAADELRARFGIPDDVTVVALVTVGSPAPDPGWSAVTSRRTHPRRPPSEVVRWEHW